MNDFNNLNDRQKEAMFCTEGPELILAGAGSGKTRVLTHRIAYLISEKHVDPWHIMAITFTNKAAEEMRSRVDSLAGQGAEAVWVATFHSSCVRILRRFISRIGYDGHFTIYDADDQKTLMKKIFRDLNIDTRIFRERNVLSAISSAKDEMTGPDEYEKNAAGYAEERTAECYRAYQNALRQNNALDFDDLLVKTVQLFQASPEVLEYYRERFRYIMVDEYQDTNTVQFKLIELLAGKYGNLCVVGDDDQSIYKFRGANIRNILNFEKSFPGAKVVKLEQNYRSTGNILDAANEVIRNNRGRKEKHLWTAKGKGERVRIIRYENAVDEADGVIKDISEKAKSENFSRFAVLYRTNAQSRLLEEKCVSYGIPYQLVGGVNFYQRKEIKDILAYLKTVANGKDDLSVMRILNVPKRGIGQTTMNKISVFAEANGIGFYEACLRIPSSGVVSSASEKIRQFTELIENFRGKSSGMTVAALIGEILKDTGYLEEMKEEGDIEAEARMENIDELTNKAVSFEKDSTDISDGEDETLPGGTSGAPVLDRFLEEVSLVADVDRMEDGEENRTGKVTLMTLHAAKGLEFSDVYMVGMEDGLFPGGQAVASGDPDELEEERRLCYVGITRAKERLTMTNARTRMVNGEMRWSEESRFLKEIPDEYKEEHAGRGRENSAFRFSKSPSPGERESTEPFRRPAFAPSPISFAKAPQVKKSDHLDYAVGDTVRHFKFGEGKVLEIADGSRDFEVTVDFGAHGVKKMFAGFAKLQKV